jgi:FMN phosphatase YigB (HAD superfamily)
MTIKTIFCDMDDTLIANAYSYHIPALNATKMIICDLQEESPHPIDIIARANEIQLTNIQSLGYISKICFPQSYIQVYVELCEKRNRKPNQKIIGAIALTTSKYFLKQYKTFPNVKETLKNITQKKIMVTRGPIEVQNHKIDSTNLRKYFDSIEIVPIKNAKTYLNLLEKYNLIAQETLMVGDSMVNDIAPALEAGLKVIRVDAGYMEWDWEHKLGIIHKNGLSKFYTIKVFPEIVNYLTIL